MIVYVITCGEYSDYRICAVATDKKKAEMLKKKFDHADHTGASIEEYDTDACELALEQNKDFYELFFRKDGSCAWIINRTTEGISRSRRFHVDDELEEHITYIEKSGNCYVCVKADDDESAVKIAVERREKYLAEKNGL